MTTKTTTPHQPADHAAQLPHSQPANSNEPTAANMLMGLWDRATPTLSRDDLVWLTQSGQEIHYSLNCIAGLLTDLACLDGEMEMGDFPSLSALKIPTVLFPVVDQLKVLASMAWIAGEAAHKLNHQGLEREGGPLHGR